MHCQGGGGLQDPAGSDADEAEVTEANAGEAATEPEPEQQAESEQQAEPEQEVDSIGIDPPQLLLPVR
jgi:hypothetical protein